MTPEQQMLDDIARRLIAAWQAKEKAAGTMGRASGGTNKQTTKERVTHNVGQLQL
jgi:hypothetical protein